MLDEVGWDVVNFIEEYHTRYGRMPSIRTIARRTERTEVEVSSALNNETVEKALDARGIVFAPVSSKRLSGEQIATIHAMLDISDKRPMKEKLKALGVTYVKYTGWKKQEYFMEAYREAAERLYGDSLPEIHQSVIAEAVNGSLAHQKLVLAISGRWDEKKNEQQMNVKYVLMKVLEIIQTHVSDPETLRAIAGEFEDILNPQQTTPALQAAPTHED